MDFQEPIEYNPKKWGYYITKPQLSGYEIRLLLDSVHEAKTLTMGEAVAITNKILELTNTYDAASFSEELKQRAPTPKAEASVSPPLFAWLLQQGRHAKILAPKEAIGELFRFLKKTETLYGYGTDKFLKDIPTTYDEMRSQKHSL